MNLKPRPQVTQPTNQSYRYIPLTQGQIAIVDAEDFDRLNQWRWYALWNPNTKSFYAVTRKMVGGKLRAIYMHREVKHALESDPTVDHWNHMTLDNRKVNLRLATYSQNQHHQKRGDNASGFKGVYEHRRGKKRWQAKIAVNGKSISCGYYLTKEEADEAYRQASLEIYGEFSYLGGDGTAQEVA
jgi:AP2 domain